MSDQSANSLPQSSGKIVIKLRKAPKPEADLNANFELSCNLQRKCYVVKISAAVALEGAWIACSIPIQFLVSKASSYEMTKTDSEAETKLGNRFSATMRLKPNCTSVEFFFRPVDGYSGSLEVFVSAVNSTGRCTQRETIPIAPLSSYRRIEILDEKRQFGTLHIKGQFSPLKVKSWMENWFQDVEKSSFRLEDHEGTFNFESMLLGCQLQCQIKEQDLLFRCENPSALAILMQILTRQATQEKIKLDLRPKLSPEACEATLLLIDLVLAPISGQKNLRSLKEAVAEISAAEGGDAMLHPTFRSEGWRRLHGKDDSVPDAELIVNTETMNFLHDLQKDYARLQGTSITSKLPDLIYILQNNYSLKNLQDFFVTV